ncbi:MAG: hypothetical protein JNK41_03055, partial [Saprospiraceae bacterium]|nr:hypothetical protein [Saprospiraceae bacterium]
MKFLLYIIIICFLIPEAKCQNFSKNYYVFDDIEGGQRTLIGKDNFVLQFFGNLPNGRYYLGLIKTDFEGNLQNKAIFDSIYSLPNIMFKSDKIYFGALGNSKLKMYIFKSNINGNIEKENSIKLDSAFHWP